MGMIETEWVKYEARFTPEERRLVDVMAEVKLAFFVGATLLALGMLKMGYLPKPEAVKLATELEDEVRLLVEEELKMGVEDGTNTSKIQ